VDVTTIDGKLNMRVIRGLRDGALVYVFSTDQIRGGFEEAAGRELEGIPFGSSSARFIHIWHTEVAIPSELSDRVLPACELVAEHPEILAALAAEHEAQVAEGRAKMEAASRKLPPREAEATGPVRRYRSDLVRTKNSPAGPVRPQEG
jgi:hypothetical protein